MQKPYIFIVFIFLAASNLLFSQEDRCSVKNLNLNSKYQDFDLFPYADSTVIFSSSRKEKSIRQPKWSGNNQPFLELYTATLGKNGEFYGIKKFSKSINTKFHDADLEFTNDLSTIYFSRSNYFKKKYVKDSLGRNLIQLYKAIRDTQGNWVEQEMPFSNKNYQTGHPALNADETKLYFVSDMPGGYGETDIYMVTMYPDGSYGSPINLGPKVNTKGKEVFPTIWKNNELYFSSDGNVSGQGGLDIFSVSLNENGLPTAEAKNLPRPLNSYRDDFSISFRGSKNSGYFSSNRPGGKGDDDIYSFECSCIQYIKGITYKEAKQLDSIQAMEYYFHDEMKRIRDSIQGVSATSSIAIANNTITESNTKSFIDSIVHTKTTRKSILPNVKVSLYQEDTGKVDSIVSNAKGEFLFRVNCFEKLDLLAEKLQFSKDSIQISSTEENADTIYVALTLKEKDILFENNEHVLNIVPFYYDFDSADISTQSVLNILTIVDIMRKYPSLHIEINSHTDSRGTDSYNMELSRKRSAVMKHWILAKGVGEDRVSTNGYGESRLTNKCSDGVPCSEEEHARNRRSEFVITKYTPQK